MDKFYTGVGSRETPNDILVKMCIYAEKLERHMFILRSGGAPGADTAFEAGVKFRKEIYLPWKGFNRSPSSLFRTTQEAMDLAKSIHPAWSKCSDEAKLLHTRNCYQVLGDDLKTPSSFLLCWTKDGEDVGGTRTAIVLARQNNIPVYNFAKTVPTVKELINEYR